MKLGALAFIFSLAGLIILRGQTGSAPAANDNRIATLETSDLVSFDGQAPAVQRLITHALAMTKENLSYKYGSADPSSGGMDCSGTIYFLLRDAGVKDVPRDSGELYQWVWEAGHFHAVNASTPKTFELSLLKPGDLLFWTGTYNVERDPPVSHVMIYLGVNRATGRRVMVGASEGRRFNDVSRYGVSVFDLEMPRPSATSRFIGYAPVPGLMDASKPSPSDKP